MKRVQDILDSNLETKIDISTNFVYADKDIQDFIKKNRLSDQYFIDNYKVFYDYYMFKNNPSLYNINPILVYSENKVDIKDKKVFQDNVETESKNLKSIVKTAYISKSVLSSKFIDVDKNNPNKIDLSRDLINIAADYLKGKKIKGLYIYGKTGIGKSFLMGALYNYFKNNGKEPAIVFYPELVRKVQAEIPNGNTVNIVDNIREQEILIIDDIGAENLTDYTRDEILAPIINYRHDEGLLTFFTSNLGIEELTSFLSTTKNSSDPTKAARLLSRILNLTDVRFFD